MATGSVGVPLLLAPGEAPRGGLATAPPVNPPDRGAVPTAWGLEPEPGLALGPEAQRGPLPGTAPGGTSFGEGMPPGYPQAAAPGSPGAPISGSGVLHRQGPSNCIRDSLNGLSRGSSPEPGGSVSRTSQRDPSPKSSSCRRGESPLYRGESPLRLLSRSGPRGSIQGPPLAPERAGTPKGAPPGPTLGNLGLCLGSIRTGSSGGPVPPGAVASSTAQPPRGSVGSGGMGAFRSGGPVRAKVDVFGGGQDPGSSLRRPRPATAPSSRGSGSRPASPLASGRPSASSRPGSPQTTRPPSPSKPAVPSYPLPASHLDRAKQRSLSGHMRRAPSPTPAFNRNPSPGRPRWRM